MADGDLERDPAPQPPIVMATDTQATIASVQLAIAQAQEQARREQKDESRFPGGRYLLPNGQYVDAEGNKHKDQKSE
jgi:hypothetical protein